MSPPNKTCIVLAALLLAGTIVEAQIFSTRRTSPEDPARLSARSVKSRAKRAWGPEQATGAPDTPRAGDVQTAWASLTRDGQDEWLELRYAEPALPVAILVYETYKPGALEKVTVFSPDRKEVSVWTGETAAAGVSKQVTVIPVKIDFPTNRVKLYIASTTVPGWNEIDAVGVVDISGKTHWAVAASASSTYAEQRPARAVVDRSRIERLESEVRRLEKELRERRQALERRLNKLREPGRDLSDRLKTRRGENGFRALFAMDRDGSNVEFLVAAPGMISSATPDWSHDGKMIAFDAVSQLEDFNKSRIFVYTLAGPSRGEFRNLGHGNVPSWSPDDRRIAFMMNPGNPMGVKWGIWVMNADGSGRTWLCPGWYPHWSPDGRFLCIEAVTERPNCLHIYDFENRRTRKLLGKKWTVEYAGATWSPDGKRVVFVGKNGGLEHLAIADVAIGEPSVKILYTEKNQRRKLIGPPVWSPDGKQIVFAIQQPDRPKTDRRYWPYTYLYSISAEVPSAPVLLEDEEVGLVNRGMTWAPDSRKIVFSSER